MVTDQLRAILPGGPGYIAAAQAYVSAFLAGEPKHYLGHNPIGRIAVAATGLVLAGTDIFYPPFGNWVAHWVVAPNTVPSALTPLSRDLMDQNAYAAMRSFRAPFAEIHEFSFYLLIAKVALDVVAVVVTELREGGALVSACSPVERSFRGVPKTSNNRK